MRNLYIIGARGYGREIYSYFLQCKPNLPDVECKGYLDDKADALDGFEGYPPIVSSVEDFIPGKNDVFICALGDPKWVKHYTTIIENKGGKFISLINPTAYIGKNTKIGDGCIIGRWAYISCDITIGKHTVVEIFSAIGHDSIVGNYCHLGAYTALNGFVKVEDSVNIYTRSNILPHKKVGENSVVGAGSIVIRNVPPNTTVYGNPAKKL